MKYNPYDDEMTGDRRTGRPPLPADSKYREQRQRGEMFEGLEENDDANHHVLRKSQYRIR